MIAKIIKGVFICLIFVFILFPIYLVHVKFFHVDVVFYSALYDALIATGMTCLVLCFAPYFKVFNSFEKLLLILVLLLGGYAFAISIPTVIDRSLSFYILEKLEQRGGGVKQSALEDIFTQEYVKEYRLIDVRLTEQVESGTIEIVNDCVKLTRKGRFLSNFSRYFRENLLPKQRLLMGDYTSDLTDPFKNSIKYSDYECQ